MIVSEFLPNGDLYDYMGSTKNLKGLSQENARFIFKQLVGAVEYCHQRPLFHRDIKLDNIMFDEDYKLRLIDFGVATTETGLLDEYYVGTPGFICPSIIRQKPYSGDKMDVFALGVCLFQLLAAFPPFTNASSGDIFYKYLTQQP